MRTRIALTALTLTALASPLAGTGPAHASHGSGDAVRTHGAARRRPPESSRPSRTTGASSSRPRSVRHTHAEHLTVEVSGDERRVQLQVRDDGIGFDPDAERREGSYGLRGLQSLVEDGGGRVEVESARGVGTTVQMVVERR